MDVICFAEGESRNYKNVQIIRAKGPVSLQGVKPGFSLKKLYFDFFLLLKFIRLFFTRQYDVVHAGEEAAFFALVLCPLKRTPFIYDMDSSMVTQLLDKSPVLAVLERPLRWFESLPVRFARIVLPCCDALADDAQRFRRGKSLEVLKDVSLLNKTRTTTLSGETLRDWISRSGPDHDTTVAEHIAMYIGNLESYQGIDLMLEGFAHARSLGANCTLVVVGGEDEHIAFYREVAEDLGIAAHVFFVGKKPVDDLYALMTMADVMLSPRTQGVNTPMKVYSYLDSGKPVLATRLPTHTQVMKDEFCVLAEPTAEAYGDGLRKLYMDRAYGDELALRAAEFIAQEHSLQAFNKRVAEIYQQL